MTNITKRRMVMQLRKEGKSYSQIKKEISVSKSTLSVWLKGMPLSREQIRLLRDINESRIEKYRETMLKKKQTRLSGYYEEEKVKWLPLNPKELYVAGLFLYWGEGAKSENHTISINNTDPKVVKFALYWMINALNIKKEDIRVFVHLYSDMDVSKEIEYWSKELNMPVSSFNKPYIKKSKRIDIDQKGFGHGTCGVRAFNTVIKERILKGIEAISDYYM